MLTQDYMILVEIVGQDTLTYGIKMRRVESEQKRLFILGSYT